MKPMNFPERKNQRRKDALRHGIAAEKTSSTWRIEQLALHSRIAENARDIRTKKAR